MAGLTIRRRLFGVEEPAKLHLLGTDAFGRDQFSRFLYGGRVSLIGALVTCGIPLTLAGFLGLTAGFHGRRIDGAVMGLAELFLVLPWLYALITVRASLPLDMDPGRSFWVMCSIVGFIGWARPARLIRGMVMSAKERDYVAAARGFGASSTYLLIRHILPQTRSVLLPQAGLLAARFVLTEATLSFLGLGISEPLPSWGNMLSAVQQYSVLVSDWWMLLPAAALVPTLFAYLMLSRNGDASQ
jgi:peptide/nickel transport system permease protein